MTIFVLFAMIFCHIVDDYYLQGLLGKLKQRSWWEENYPDEKYRNDYIIALLEHAFSWSFMIMLPVFLLMWKNDCISVPFYVIAFLINMLVHAVIDHLKANRRKFGLLVDQVLHLVQILVTWIALMLCVL